jgi:hypothetical protein
MSSLNNELSPGNFPLSARSAIPRRRAQQAQQARFFGNFLARAFSRGFSENRRGSARAACRVSGVLQKDASL